MILNDQILGIFSVYKWCDISSFRGFHRLHILHAQSLQISGNNRIGTGCDLIDHGPGEGDLIFIFYIAGKSLIHISLFQPFFRHGQHRAAQKAAVFGTVVHGYQGKRRTSFFIPFQEHGCNYAHGPCGFIRTIVNVRLDIRQVFSLRVGQGIAFFRNGKGYQLQRRGSKNFFQTIPLFRVCALSLYSLSKSSQDFVISGSVSIQDNAESQIVEGAVDLVHYIIVKSFYTGESCVQFSLFQQSVCNTADENAEDISNAKVCPSGGLLRFFCSHFYVITGKRDAGSFPFPFVFDSFQRKFHLFFLPSNFSCLISGRLY